VEEYSNSPIQNPHKPGCRVATGRGNAEQMLALKYCPAAWPDTFMRLDMTWRTRVARLFSLSSNDWGGSASSSADRPDFSEQG